MLYCRRSHVTCMWGKLFSLKAAPPEEGDDYPMTGKNFTGRVDHS